MSRDYVQVTDAEGVTKRVYHRPMKLKVERDLATALAALRKIANPRSYAGDASFTASKAIAKIMRGGPKR